MFKINQPTQKPKSSTLQGYWLQENNLSFITTEQEIQSTTAKASSNYCQRFFKKKTKSIQSHEANANVPPFLLI